MAWRIAWSNRARREFVSLSETDQQAVSAALKRLTTDVGTADIKKLAGRSGQWRLRVGRWRVLLDLDNRDGVITVASIVARDRAYRD